MKKVLIVDDQPDVARTLSQLVASGGYDVITATRFDEARHLIDQTPPDILVTDVRLGAFNGLQLVLHMRSVSADAPIVVLSAFDDPMIRQDAERAGAMWLTKPVTRRQLLECLGRGSSKPAGQPT